MHLSFLFSGAGTLLLGPTLPLFAQRWHLHDSDSGLLIAAQFAGLFFGAIALWPSLRRSLLSGYLVAGSGFLLLALCLTRPGGYVPAIFALFLLGLGLGQVTTTVNLLSALSTAAAQRRSAALSLLNFTWSAGAVLAPLIAGFTIAHASLLTLLLAFPVWACLLFAVAARTLPAMAHAQAKPEARQAGIGNAVLAYYFALFLLYGGLEATVSGWLSTYTLRYTPLGVAAAAYATSALWISFALGRALAALILRFTPERALRIAGVLLAAGAAAALRGAHTGLAIAVCASLIGLGLGPFFPVTFSILVSKHPAPRQAGAATANIGLGSAIFPYITGLLSTHMGSLQIAMLTPLAIALALLLMIVVDRQNMAGKAQA